MQRRTLLQLLLVGGAFLWRTPQQALALGGTLPSLNQPAPGFDCPGTSRRDPNRAQWSLQDFRGQWLVLYFYPRDFTSGCTLEAHGFQAALADFEAAGASIAAVSADPVDEHASFCSSEGLDFVLLSDPKGQVSQRYGSWMAPFSMRHTFLIDPKGVLRQIWTGVRPAGHAREVLASLQTLQATG